GGATELASKAKKVIVVMTHLDKYHNSKLVKECTLPLTAKQCVSMIITDRGVFTVDNGLLTLIEVFRPYSIEEIKNSTEAKFMISQQVAFID
ncbi:acyl CoA:acetate/3-ketoacid CoA transferase subunit beta, partial [Bacillus haikouensis]|uniref:CoA-transferase n=1 Tax=Bacillus haikouensis TaxID=1510468 RepID=UPI0024842427